MNCNFDFFFSKGLHASTSCYNPAISDLPNKVKYKNGVLRRQCGNRSEIIGKVQLSTAEM